MCATDAGLDNNWHHVAFAVPGRLDSELQERFATLHAAPHHPNHAAATAASSSTRSGSWCNAQRGKRTERRTYATMGARERSIVRALDSRRLHNARDDDGREVNGDEGDADARSVFCDGVCFASLRVCE